MSAEDPMAPAPRKRPTGLGRGLSALLGETAREEPLAPEAKRSGAVQMVAVSDIRPNPDQPRRRFAPEALAELAESIAQRGVFQPILVRPNDGGYQIVAGERRWRAAQLAHLHQIPVIIKEFSDSETLEVGLIENIQRQDLNAIEEAEAYQRLVNDHGHAADSIGRLVNKSRSHVTNLLRLLDLPARVRTFVAEGTLTMGHARALITAPDPVALAERVIAKGLSVRETETLAREARPRGPRLPPMEYKGNRDDADIAALERHLGDLLGLKVSIKHGVISGAVTLSYSSLDQLDMICQRLSGEKI